MASSQQPIVYSTTLHKVAYHVFEMCTYGPVLHTVHKYMAAYSTKHVVCTIVYAVYVYAEYTVYVWYMYADIHVSCWCKKYIGTQVPVVNYAAQNLASVLPDSSLE